MSNGKKRTMTIHFVNGGKATFEFPATEDQYTAAGRIEDILKANQIILELEEKAASHICVGTPYILWSLANVL